MHISPFINAKDLTEMLGVSGRSARGYIQKIAEKRLESKGADDYLSQGRNKCLSLYEVLLYTSLNRANILLYFEKALNDAPSARLRAMRIALQTSGRWQERNVLFADNAHKAFTIKRAIYTYPSSVDEADSPGVFGFTVVPSLLFCARLEGAYGKLLRNSRPIKSLGNVFYDVSVNAELIDYMGKCCGRRNLVNEVVLVEEMDGLSEVVFYDMIDNLGRRLDRKRCLVFLPEAMVPAGLREMERIQGFWKLEESGFYVAGGINNWIEVKLGVKYARLRNRLIPKR